MLAQSWIPQASGTTASLRGVSAVDGKIVWASGTRGTYLRSIDGGATWRAATVPGAANLDFRGIRAFDDRAAILLSSGEGELSRIYKTANRGDQWTLLFTDPDPKGFFDAIAFWDNLHGIVIGDPVDGHFAVFTTSDGGQSWQRRKTPPALEKEGAFAASNTCLAVRGAREAWFATSGARVFHTTDGGETWSASKTPMRRDSASSGIFSLAFSDARHGVAVGGDYNKTAETAGNVALTSNSGKTWTAPASGPAGFRSAVLYLPGAKMWIAAGTSGSDVSLDGGASWKQFDSGNYNALAAAAGSVWAVGPKGAIARLQR